MKKSQRRVPRSAPLHYAVFQAPRAVGSLVAAESGGRIVTLSFLKGRSPSGALASLAGGAEARRVETPVLARALGQLEAYFSGTLRAFDLPLLLAGTPFQKKAWAALRRIPYGRTASYGEQAKRCGAPRAARAVGAANRANPVAIVVPCHRVIGADGSLTGFGAGVKVKKYLLDHEARVARRKG